MSTLAGILSNALRWYHERYQMDCTSSRLRIAIEQFHRASGPEQADVIRALLGLTKSKDSDGKWCDLHNVMRLLGKLTPFITLRDCVDEATRLRISNMLHAKHGRGWEDPTNVDWSEVIRCVEGERNIVLTIYREDAWRRWFVQEAKRHECYFGKDSPSDCWVERDGMLFSNVHARECRKIADEIAVCRISPPQFYERRLARYQEQIDKYDTETDVAIPSDIEGKIRELEEQIAQYRVILKLTGKDRVIAFEKLFGVARDKGNLIARMEREQNKVQIEMLKKLGLSKRIELRGANGAAFLLAGVFDNAGFAPVPQRCALTTGQAGDGDTLQLHLTRGNTRLLYSYMTITISKITRAGQITLPKKIRTRKAFANVHAVVFEDRGGEIIVRPLKSPKKQEFARDHLPFVEYTMREWLDPANDNLFKMPEDL